VATKQLQELKARMKSSLDGLQLEVGVLGAKAREREKDADGEPVPYTVGEVAHVLYYGNARIPARPFIALAIDKNRAELGTIITVAGKAVGSGRKDARTALGLVGEYLRSKIQETISDGVPPPNAESTIQQKRSQTPLIRHGQLRSSISYRIRLSEKEDAGE
jgi:hypothetical protein